MNKATKGVEWIDVPIVEEVPEPQVEEIQHAFEQDLNLSEYEQPNEPGYYICKNQLFGLL